MIAVQHTAGVISSLWSHDLVASTTRPDEEIGLVDMKTSFDAMLEPSNMVCLVPLQTS